ncbi:hypothetical protein GGI07_003383 [Coemansia sp. Benny D115]|nr:hypothetical protein GGI07_003383 [Coemansia sp. Benny D115]
MSRKGKKWVDYSRDDEPPDYIFIGTPLPNEQEQRNIQRLQQSTWDGKPKDYSRDAFKGGYTAGYYGTVGSKEGWAPTASFVSSRDNRAKYQGMRVEDYMDEEDLADRRATRKVSVARQYIGEERAMDSYESDKGAERSVVGLMAEKLAGELGALVQASQRTSQVGYKVMAAMGWKPGQGVGAPKRAVRRPVEQSIAGVDDERTNISNTANSVVLLPPKATSIPMAIETPRRNARHGVDFGVDIGALPNELANDDAGSGLPVLGVLFKAGTGGKGGMKTGKSKKKKKKKMQQQAGQKLSFGAFDQDDDDDQSEDEGGWKNDTQLGRLANERQRLNTGRTRAKGTGVGGDIRSTVCHDGRAPLSGFELVRKPEDYTVPDLGIGVLDVPSSFDGVHRSSTALHDDNSEQGRLVASGTTNHKWSSRHNAGASAIRTDNTPQLSSVQSTRKAQTQGIVSSTVSGLSVKDEADGDVAAWSGTSILTRFARAGEVGGLEDERHEKVDVSKNKEVVRTLGSWMPSHLLCRRMGIKPARPIPPTLPESKEPVLNDASSRPVTKQGSLVYDVPNIASVSSVSSASSVSAGRRRMQAADFFLPSSAGIGDTNETTTPRAYIDKPDDEKSVSYNGKTPTGNVSDDKALFRSIFGND